MAVKTFHVLNTLGVSPFFGGNLQEGGSAPAAALCTFGHTVAKSSNGFFFARLGANLTAAASQATSTIDSRSGPTAGTGTTTTTAGDSFKTPSAHTGTFAAGNWTLAFGMRTAAGTVVGRIRCRIWASVNANSAGARELTSGTLVGSSVTMNSTTATFTSSITWAAPEITLANEYLFFQVEWNETTAGTSNSSTATYYQSACSFTTTNFTPTAPIVTQRHFRWRGGSDAVDAAPSWSANEDTNLTNLVGSRRLRIQLDNTGSATDGNWSLWYSHNGGAYTKIGSTVGALVYASSVSSSADDEALTIPRLTSPGLTFVNGINDENAVLASPVLTEGTYTEIDFNLNWTNSLVVHGDTFDFRVRYGSTPLDLQSYAVTPRLTATKELYSQKNFRFRSDTGAVDATPTWSEAENTNLTGIGSGVPLRLRMVVDNTGANPQTSPQFHLLVSRNSGAYGTASASSYINASTAASTDADGTDVTVQRLTSGSGTFLSGEYSESNSTGSVALIASRFTEVEFGFVFEDTVVNGDTYDFRLGVFGATPLSNYVSTPRITTIGPIPTPDAWHIGDRTIGVALSNADKTATSTSGTQGVRSTEKKANKSAGKYYAEFLIDDVGVSNYVGINSVDVLVAATGNPQSFKLALGSASLFVNSAVVADLGDPVVNGDVVCFAWDAGAERVWCRVNNGLWNNDASANPATNTNGFDTSYTDAYDRALWSVFAQTGDAVTIRTETAEFTQAMPSGFKPWFAEAKTLYFKNATANGALSIQDGGTPPTAGLTTTGWIQGTRSAPNNYSLMAVGSERATTTFLTQDQLGNPSFSAASCWRSENTFKGSFEDTDWTFNFLVRADTVSANQAGHVLCRVWKSTNADGSGATELTSTPVSLEATGALSTSASQSSGGTWDGPPVYSIARALGSSSLFGDVDTRMGYYQTFTVPDDANSVTDCSLVLKKNGSPTDNLTCELFAVDGSGVPTGSALGSCTPLAGSGISTTLSRTLFTFPDAVSVSPNTRYAVAVKRTAAAADGVNNYSKGSGGISNIDLNQGSGDWTKSTGTFGAFQAGDFDLVVFGPREVILDDEYLWVQCEWQVTTAGTDANSDALFYIDTAACIVTPKFFAEITIPLEVGALVAGAASVVGDGVSLATGTGTLAAQSATTNIFGTSESVGAGALTSSAVAAGVGVAAWSGSGALVAGDADLDAVGLVETPPVTGTGVLTTGISDLDSLGLSQSTGPAALVPLAATLSGAGVSQVVATGALNAAFVSATRTNYAKHSQAFENSSGWMNSGVTVAANNATAPDSTLTADTATITNASHILRQTVNAVGTTAGIYTYSVHAKYVAGGPVYLKLETSDFSTPQGAYFAHFNLQDGTVGDKTAGLTTTSESLGNGWYRFSLTGYFNFDVDIAYLHLYYRDAALAAVSSGQIILWGAQYEKTGAPTAYIATTTVPVTVTDTMLYGRGIAGSLSTSAALQAQSNFLQLGGGVSSSTGTAALLAASSIVAGAGEVLLPTGTGTLLAGASAVAGSGLVQSPPAIGTGTLTSGVADLDSLGLSQSFGPAALTSFATMSGAGLSQVAATGALVASSATVAASGISSSRSASAALAAQTSFVFASGVSSSAGTGTLASNVAAIVGAGLGPSWVGSGALASAPATLAGVGVSTWRATGALVAGIADLDGAGLNRWAASGTMPAQIAALAGAGASGSVGTAALQTFSTLTGVGFVATGISGIGNLTSSATLTAAGISRSVSTSATLTSVAATVTAAAVSESRGTGTMPSAPSALSAFGLGSSVGTAILTAQVATAVGLGASRWVATGALPAGSASIVSTGLVRWTGTGTLGAGAAALVATGISSSRVITAALQASVASIFGAEGVVVIQGSGTLPSQSATVVGVGRSISAGTGTLTALPASLAGAGLSRSQGAAPLLSQASVINGTGQTSAFGFGNLVATASALVGVGTVVAAPTGTGTLLASASAVVGAGTVVAATTGTGALVAGVADVDGTGLRQWVATGALAAQTAVVNGAGKTGWQGSGALAAQVATATGAGLARWSGTGALSAGNTATTGVGLSFSLATAQLLAARSTIIGAEGVVVISGAGALQAQSRLVTGAGASRSSGTGALVVTDPAEVVGSAASGSLGTAALQPTRSVLEGTAVSGGQGAGALNAAGAVLTAPGIATWLGDGALAAGGASLAGVFVSGSRGTGVLVVSDLADMAGAGISRVEGDATLASRPASVFGSAFLSTQGTGELVAQDHALTGVGAQIATGWGVLRHTTRAEIVGVGFSGSVGVGAVVPRPALMLGFSTSVAYATGELVASSATIVGTEQIVTSGSGEIICGAAEIVGVGMVGVPTLPEPTPLPGSYPGTAVYRPVGIAAAPMGGAAAPTMPPPAWWLGRVA